MFHRTLKLFFVAGFVCAAANASIIFNFDQDSLGTASGFTDTSSGLSATF